MDNNSTFYILLTESSISTVNYMKKSLEPPVNTKPFRPILHSNLKEPLKEAKVRLAESTISGVITHCIREQLKELNISIPHTDSTVNTDAN